MTLLQMRGLSKNFGGVKALTSVDLDIGAGEVRGLIGENGSGKSTTVRILAGEHTPDTGTVRIDDVDLPHHGMAERIKARVGVVFQEPQLAPTLTVTENLLLGRLPGPKWLVDWRKAERDAAEALDAVGLDIDPNRLVESLSQDEAHFVEVARVLATRPRIVALDETTASLTSDRVRHLFDVVRQLKSASAAVLLITHRLEEVESVCDTVSVLRDGVMIDTVDAATPPERLVEMMVGRAVEAGRLDRGASDGEIALKVRGVIPRANGDDYAMTVRAGEIVGIGGLVGSGRSELLGKIFGMLRHDGEVEINGRMVPSGQPRSAIEAGAGFVPEDRRAQGLALSQTIRANASMVHTGTRRLTSLTNRSDEAALLSLLFDRLALKAVDGSVLAGHLSGGNQQKIVIGRWVHHSPKVLLLDEPTRGIDIGSKREIHELVAGLAAEGHAVVLVSSELAELQILADRIIVLREGRVVAELPGDASDEELGQAMMDERTLSSPDPAAG